MSGIVAMVWTENSRPELAMLEKMTAHLAYRGPDTQHAWSDAHAGLGHALLNVGPPENQPFSPDNKIWITADARIDDRDDLALLLKHHGSKVNSDTLDAALIPEAYRAFGADCPKYLVGDFAFAIWDQPAQRLLAAVDRFAIRPLFYAWAGKTFIVSNCLATIRLHPAVAANLDETALGDFLLFGNYRDGSATIFAGIRRLPSAHMLILESGRLTIRRYWSPSLDSMPLPREGHQLVEQFRSVLSKAVAARLRTGRAALLMSGGLDSAVIAASASTCHPPGSSPPMLTAHTVIYERLIPDDEKTHATLIAQALKLPISFYAADEFEIFDWIKRLEWAPPEPLELPGLGASVDFHRQLAGDGPVVLTGNDGDTLFGGSSPAHFRSLVRTGDFGTLLRNAAWYTYHRRHVPLLSKIRRWRNGKATRSLFPVWLRPEFARRAGLEERWSDALRAPSSNGPRDRVPETLTSPRYARTFEPFDPAWTRQALEFRHPLMDLHVVEFLLSLPTVPWCVEKELFRRVLPESFPSEVRLRPKTPLRADPLIRQVFRKQESWLAKPNLHPELDHYIDRAKLSRLEMSMPADQVWVALRPVALDFWWRRQKS